MTYLLLDGPWRDLPYITLGTRRPTVEAQKTKVFLNFRKRILDFTSQTMNLLHLPDDVLFVILGACSKPSLNSLSFTSSQCKDLAETRLLHTVRLDRNPSQIISFLNYILSNTRPSKDDSKKLIGAGTQVRTFEVLYPAFKMERDNWRAVETLHPVSTWAPTLTRALALMPNLRAITIAHDVDVIAHCSPEFASTLLSRPQLHTLALTGLKSLTSEQFGKAMTSAGGGIHLQKVILTVPVSEDLQLSVGEGMGSVLFHSRKTLIELRKDSCNLRGLLCGDQRAESSDTPDRIPVVFPNVTHISLSHCNVSSYALSHSFPNVHTFRISRGAFTEGNTCPTSCSTSRITSHQLFPKLSSLQGRFYSDLKNLLESYGPYDDLRRVVAGEIVGDAEEVLVPLTVLRLESFHFHITNTKTISWWKGLADSLLHLKFLAFTTNVRTGADIELLVSMLPSFFEIRLLKYFIDLVDQTSKNPCSSSPGIHSSSSKLRPVPLVGTSRRSNSVLAHRRKYCPGLRTEYTDTQIHRDLHSSGWREKKLVVGNS